MSCHRANCELTLEIVWVRVARVCWARYFALAANICCWKSWMVNWFETKPKPNEMNTRAHFHFHNEIHVVSIVLFLRLTQHTRWIKLASMPVASGFLSSFYLSLFRWFFKNMVRALFCLRRMNNNNINT